MSLPNPCDDDDVGNFKAHVKCRHETFNGRIKYFCSLSDTYKHSKEKHKYVFEAIAVTVQYQMDNGSPLFDA